jgi:hypothetical protein
MPMMLIVMEIIRIIITLQTNIIQIFVNMNIEIIVVLKSKIIELSLEHKLIGDNLDDYKDSDLIEIEAEQLVVSYCESNVYLVNGFPIKKKILPVEDLEEDYFCRERYKLYLDTLAIQKEDVSELMWCYVSSFWEDQFSSKDEYIQNLKDNIDSGVFYDITI